MSAAKQCRQDHDPRMQRTEVDGTFTGWRARHDDTNPRRAQRGHPIQRLGAVIIVQLVDTINDDDEMLAVANGNTPRSVQHREEHVLPYISSSVDVEVHHNDNV